MLWHPYKYVFVIVKFYSSTELEKKGYKLKLKTHPLHMK